MALFVETDSEVTADDANTGSGTFEPIPAGDYEVTIKKAEVIDYSKKPEWSGKKALNVQLRVVDDAPVGKGRVFFIRVPLFQSAPRLKSEKNPKGVAYGYFSFGDALGLSKLDIDAGNLPDIRDILGKRLSANITVKPKDDWHETAYNDVKYVNKSKGAPAGTAVGKDDPWAPSAPADDPWSSNEITLPKDAPVF